MTFGVAISKSYILDDCCMNNILFLWQLNSISPSYIVLSTFCLSHDHLDKRYMHGTVITRNFIWCNVPCTCFASYAPNGNLNLARYCCGYCKNHQEILSTAIVITTVAVCLLELRVPKPIS